MGTEMVEDGIETREALHGTDGEDLHFRFIGHAKQRQFVVNVQVAAADTKSGEKLKPEEYDFMVSKVLNLILKNLGKTPNPALH